MSYAAGVSSIASLTLNVKSPRYGQKYTFGHFPQSYLSVQIVLTGLALFWMYYIRDVHLLAKVTELDTQFHGVTIFGGVRLMDQTY